ncbi:MAG: LacI family DNA-binding transcriptional regulator [Phycisphaerales bacterium]|nr:LacI family DNA-binding transcriptional regulator [Phycisphaerales bacterium]
MSQTVTPSKLEQIAREAGVSVRTVYRVLQGENKENWPSSSKRGQLIRKISQKINFAPDANARSLRNGRKMQIAVLLRNTEGGSYLEHYPEAFEIILGINETLEQEGYCTTLATLGDVLHPRNAHSRIFRERMVDGLIVISQMPDNVLDAVGKLAPTCLWVHSNVWREKNCIRRDEIYAGQTTAGALVELGYQKLVWLGPPQEDNRHYSEMERLEGVREVAAQSGIPLTEFTANDAAELAAQGRELAKYFDPRTAFVAYSSRYAQWLTACATRMRRIAPEDFGLGCCDDSRQVESFWPELSRMGFNQFELGRRVGAMMLENLSSGHGSDSQRVREAWIAGKTARAGSAPRTMN